MFILYATSAHTTPTATTDMGKLVKPSNNDPNTYSEPDPDYKPVNLTLPATPSLNVTCTRSLFPYLTLNIIVSPTLT